MITTSVEHHIPEVSNVPGSGALELQRTDDRSFSGLAQHPLFFPARIPPIQRASSKGMNLAPWLLSVSILPAYRCPWLVSFSFLMTLLPGPLPRLKCLSLRVGEPRCRTCTIRHHTVQAADPLLPMKLRSLDVVEPR